MRATKREEKGTNEDTIRSLRSPPMLAGGVEASLAASEVVAVAEERPRPRIRERAREVGAELLSDEELLALLIERGVPGEPLEPRVVRVLREAGGIDGLASLGVTALADDFGLGLACAARIVAGIELGLRVARRARELGGTSAGSSEDVERWARGRIVHLAHEELWVLLLDARNRLVGERLVARGGLHACATTPRDVLRPVVREAAGAFVLVHNHPGGDPCPSREDVFFTRRVAEAASAVGVALVDHVVVARDGHVSLLEAGLFETSS